jgi:hypothetical protein
MSQKKIFGFGVDQITGLVIHTPGFDKNKQIGGKYPGKCLIYVYQYSFVGDDFFVDQADG